jgi:hypothetical protein
MSPSHVQLRVNFATRELEVAGSSKDVREWFERLEALFGNAVSKVGGAQGRMESLPAVSSNIGSISERSFGEYLLSFPRDVSDVDRALIAGFFIQESDPDRVFATSAVSDILREQGFKLSNPSASVKRNQLASRVFLHGKGRFRVSKDGVDYLAQLRGAVARDGSEE